MSVLQALERAMMTRKSPKKKAKKAKSKAKRKTRRKKVPLLNASQSAHRIAALRHAGASVQVVTLPTGDRVVLTRKKKAKKAKKKAKSTRSPAQIAATKRMLAANKRSKRNRKK